MQKAKAAKLSLSRFLNSKAICHKKATPCLFISTVVASLLFSGCAPVGQAISSIPKDLRPNIQCKGGLCEDIKHSVAKEDAQKQTLSRTNKPLVSEQCGDFIAGKVGGTLVGAGGGALLGSKLGGNRGAVIGGVLGGLAGYLIGKQIDERRQKLCLLSQKTNTKILMGDITAEAIDDNATKKSVEADVLAIPEIKFKNGSAEIDEKQKETIGEFAKVYVEEDSDKKILIIGNTDGNGEIEKEQELSEQRAKAIAQIYKEQGIPEENIYYQGAGSSMPIAPKESKEAKSYNQRAEIAVFKTEEQLVKAVQKRKPNPANFDTVADTSSKTVKQKDKKQTVAKAASKPTSQKVDAATDSKPLPIPANSIDFGGVLASKSSPITAMIGNPKAPNQWLPSLITPAYASSNQAVYKKSCKDDSFKPQYDPSTIKKLSNGQKLDYKTSEYYNGLNESVWVSDNVKGNYVALAPMAVLRSGTKPVSEPNLQVWKNYATDKKPTPDISVKTQANVYEGEKGLLYRVFAADKSSQIMCSDMFISANGQSGKQQIYYRKNGGVFVSDSSSQKMK